MVIRFLLSHPVHIAQMLQRYRWSSSYICCAQRSGVLFDTKRQEQKIGCL